MRLENISISFASNTFLMIIGIIVLAAYSFYIYKYTIPQVSSGIKYFLISIRIISLVLLFIIIFEPILNLKSENVVEPVAYLFVDNSNSITAKDSVKRKELIKNIVSEITNYKTEVIPILFSDKTKSFNLDSLAALDFSGRSTNFYNIISGLKNSDKNTSSAVIISDGIVNDGTSPIFDAEKLTFPIFTIGIGDTSKYRDVGIADVTFNQYIYAKKNANIEAIISQHGYDNRNVRAELYADDKLVSSEVVQLNPAGINKLSFAYTPQNNGEIKMHILVTSLEGEDNIFNNSKFFFINALKNKIKIGLIAGSPSADLSSISNALESDKDLDIKKIIQVSPDKYWKDYNPAIIDSSDVLFLVDFPSANTPQNLIEYVAKEMRNKNKSFFFLLSQNVSFEKLKQLENFLPFIISGYESGLVQAEPNLTDNNSITSGFSSSLKRSAVWENLPPVVKSNSILSAKPGSNVIARSIVRNQQTSSPLLITRSIGNQRAIAVLAGDIWKWELAASEKYPGFFSNMIGDFVKWLNVSEKQKQFSVKTSKKIYSINEPVEFTAELYDQTFSPIDSADISIVITKSKNKYEIPFTPESSGIYKTVFDLTSTGDYNYQGIANINGNTVKSEAGRFSVVESSIEKENTQMDADFLKLLAFSSNGKYFPGENIDGLKEQLENRNTSTPAIKTVESEIDFRSNEWIMLVIICLFAAEWFIRKRSGML